MTEAEWLAATDPTPMRRFLLSQQLLARTWRGRVWQKLGYQVYSCSHRKVTLFALACCRYFWDCFDKCSEQPIIEAVEHFVDGSLPELEIQRIQRIATDRLSRDGGELRPDAMELLIEFSLGNYVIAGDHIFHGDVSSPFYNFLYLITRKAFSSMTCDFMMDGGPDDVKEAVSDIGKIVAGLLREVVGSLPFRPVAIDPTWLTSTVSALATGVYTDRAFDRLPILADALQDAGCDNNDILSHLRGGGPHVKGCWALDRVLARE